MNTEQKLSDLKKGQTAIVSGLKAEGSMRRRLQDIGLICGTRVECLGMSPLGDPTAYLIRGAVIALRSRDAEEISVANVRGMVSAEKPAFQRSGASAANVE